MRHLKEIDRRRRTVLMVQPENEIGMVDYPTDHSPAANERYAAEVPLELMEYLVSHKKTLTPELRAASANSGFADTGRWTERYTRGRNPLFIPSPAGVAFA